MSSKNPALIIFIKNPIPGKAKTRIAQTAGIKKAHDIYIQLLEITRGYTTKTQTKKYLFYDQFIDHEDEWEDSLFEKKLQSDGDLGKRMACAFDEISKKHEQIAIIGSDCPYLTSKKLEAAFAVLQKTEIVIGPSTDGGYYLLGMKKFHPELFENILWSTSSVFQKTIEIAEQNKWTIGVLEHLTDIDTEEDWNNYKGI